MPSSAQRAYFALRAWNVELASVKDHQQTREANSGTTVALQVRMQWWRNALREIYGEPREATTDPLALNLSISCWHNPVVRALAAAHEETQFTRRFLERLIDSREYDLEVNEYTTMQELTHYAEESSSSLLYLALEATGVRDDAADAVASHAGIGIGLATAIRGTPFRLAQSELSIPRELLARDFQLQSLQDFYLNDNPEAAVDVDAWRNAIRQVAAEAAAHLNEAQALQSQVPKEGRVALLPLVPAQQFLGRLERADYDVFSSTAHDDNRLRLLLLLARSWLTNVL